MALETVVYPQEQHGYDCKELVFLQSHDEESSFLHIGESSSCNPMMQNQVKEYNWDICNINIVEENNQLFLEGSGHCNRRRKRRRTGNYKKEEELENQRIIHIAVERNRRKQMNEYLTVLRSLMPPSYVQRADQASIIGGAINFVKELEHHLQFLQAQNTIPHQQLPENGLFSDFFSFPQYSNRATEVEVKLVESHANLKILSKRRPRQLIKIVAGLHSLCLTVLHLNVTTVHQMVLYSLTTKVEEGCQLTTVEEITQAVNQLLGRIQEED